MYKNSSGVVKQYVAESFSQITPGLPIPTAFRPFFELAANKNLYSGAPVLGIYELQRLDELRETASLKWALKAQQDPKHSHLFRQNTNKTNNRTNG